MHKKLSIKYENWITSTIQLLELYTVSTNKSANFYFNFKSCQQISGYSQLMLNECHFDKYAFSFIVLNTFLNLIILLPYYIAV